MAGRLGAARFWGEFEDDDITRLPRDYEAKVTDDDRVYFVNHSKEETHWENPLDGLRYKVMPGLPYGWQKFKDNEERIVFVDHLSQMCISVDPRLITKSVYDFPQKYGIKGYTSVQNFFRPLVRAEEVCKGAELEGKVVIVTGGNSGLGYQTSLNLAKQGAHVILACRSATRAEEAIAKIRTTHPGANVEYMHLDLASLHSVKAFARDFISREMPLHILVCNAGILTGSFGLTTDGVEQHFGVNHLGHFYLCQQLAPALLRSKPSRVVVVTSESHWYPSDSSSKLDLHALRYPNPSNFRPITAYGASHLCNLLFALEFHRRYVERGVSCNAVHPGNFLPTRLSAGGGLWYRAAFALARPFTKSVEQGAATILYAACHHSMKAISGLYLHECWPVDPSPEAQDPSTASALWELCQDIVEEKMREGDTVDVF